MVTPEGPTMAPGASSRNLSTRKKLPWLDKPEAQPISTPCETSTSGTGASKVLSFPDNARQGHSMRRRSSTNVAHSQRDDVEANNYTNSTRPRPIPLDATVQSTRTSSDDADGQMSKLIVASHSLDGEAAGSANAPRNSPSHSYARQRSPLRMLNDWLQSELDLPLDEAQPAETPRMPREQGNGFVNTSAATAHRRDSTSMRTDTHQPRPSINLTSKSRGTLPTPTSLSVPHMRSSSYSTSAPTFPRQKKSSLAPLPPHLLASSGSSSSDEEIQSARQAFASGVNADASEVPASLSRAVTGLENLVEEALNLAKDAAQNGQAEDVAHVLNEATVALRKASSVQSSIWIPRARHASLSSSSSESDHEDTQLDTSHQSRASSIATAPTVLTLSTKSRRPSITAEFSIDDSHGMRSRRASLAQAVKTRSRSSSEEGSVQPTPPRLYTSTSLESADSIVRDFAYTEVSPKHKPERLSLAKGERDDTQSENLAADQASLSTAPMHHGAVNDDGYAGLSGITEPGPARVNGPPQLSPRNVAIREPLDNTEDLSTLREVEPVPIDSFNEQATTQPREGPAIPPRNRGAIGNHPAFRHARERSPEHTRRPDMLQSMPEYNKSRRRSSARDPLDSRHYGGPPSLLVANEISEPQRYSDPYLALKNEDLSLKHPRRSHLSLRGDQGFSLGRFHKRRPIAREWSSRRKRIVATITCLNTIFIGLIAGVYAGEVPRIQYQIADQNHLVLYGNVLLFAGLGITTLLFWPLPLLHGRKPYVSMAFALLLPLQFPQAIAIGSYRNPHDSIYRFGLLFPRAIAGLALGFANINFLPTLLDLYGASLMSKRPHQEVVIYDDVRRQGGGMGIWLGLYTFCFSSALSIGFCIGACIISRLDPSWGFYVVMVLLALFLFINVLTPETRRAPYRRSIAHFFDEKDPERLKRRLARGEVKLHISNYGPKWWYQEVWAGLILTKHIVLQPGFFVLMCYMAWIKAQLTLVILLLGALLSRDYRWQSQFVGLAALAVPIGAVLAMPLTRASWFSRSRSTPPRTDSMTFQPRLTWTSHLVRRVLFSLTLPVAALAYCITAPGPPTSWVAPVVFSGAVGFLTDLGIAECIGLIMETFDTCDLQPGVNTRHRLVSLAPDARRRRTNYSAFPRVCAAFFAADALAWLLSAVATGVSGRVTRAYGAQTALGIVAAVLLAVTVLLLAVLWRWRELQVIPHFTAGATLHGTAMWSAPDVVDPAWKPVIVGNPSGKTRRMNLLEMGAWSRWTEIRKLNGLIRE